MRDRRTVLGYGATALLILPGAERASGPARAANAAVLVHATVAFGRPIDAAIRRELDALAETTRAEPGCEAYHLAIDMTDSTCLRLFEKWTDLAALEGHFRTAHMRRFRAGLRRYSGLTSTMQVFELGRAVPFRAPPIDSGR